MNAEDAAVPGDPGRATAEAIAKLEFLRLRCRLICTAHGVLPSFTGALLHGVLGATLRRVDPERYCRYVTPAMHLRSVVSGAAEQGPPAFALFTPERTRRRVLPGDELRFEVTLFGRATRDAGIWIDTVTQAAQSGLGERGGAAGERALFVPDSIEVIQPAGVARFLWYPGTTGPSPASTVATVSGTALAAALVAPPVRLLRLEFESPLRLKHDDRILRSAPAFAILVHRLVDRFDLIAQLHCNSAPLAQEARRSLLVLAQSVRLHRESTRWQEYPRYSGRQQASMVFGGVSGQAEYAGDLAPFLPWLAVAEWLHVGGKASFGFGRIRVAACS